MTDEMKIETFTAVTKEVFATGAGISVTVTPWANLEGVSYVVHNKEGAPVAASAMRWEEADVFLAALTLARAV